MNVVFMGTPAFAVPSLELLARSSHRVLHVVTQPDRPAGRGRQLRPSPVARTAEVLALPVTKPEVFRSDEVVASLRSVGADVFTVVAFGEILRRRHLEIPPRGCVNLHPSLLPRHRGPVPIQAALLAGDDVTGVTTILMDRGVDTGHVLLQRAVEIDTGEDAGSLHDRLSRIGAELLVATLDARERDELTPIAQDEERATRCGLLSKDDGRLDFRLDALSIYRRVRAFTPWPGIFADRPGGRVAILRVEVVEVVSRHERPGRIIGIDRDGSPLVACGAGTLRVLRLKPSGSTAMSGAEFLRGHPSATSEIWGGDAPVASENGSDGG